MTIVLYDLCGADDRRFSPNCWRTRLALEHKRLDYEARPVRFTEIPAAAGAKTVPTILDDGRTVTDSWAIAEYLEDTYPDAPSLFGGDGGRVLSRFVQAWVDSVLHLGVIRLVVRDIHDHLAPEDQAYFRESREKRFGATLEAVQQDRDERLEAFRQSLVPLRLRVKQQSFLGGEAPLYADYLAFGAFLWARSISPVRLLAEGDPVRAWVERCLDLYDGVARRQPGYW